jgi:DHA3 family tetracycline resistance protein-like MFS transporter
VSLFRALKHWPFALLWGGQSISRIGDFLYQIALAWWVLQKTGSPEAMGTVLIFSFGPMVLFLLIGGVAVDRLPRIPVLFLSDALRGGIVCMVAIAAYANRLQIWQVYLASLIFGFLDAFFQPAFTAVIPEITPADKLTSANSLNSLSFQFGRVVGPAIGSFLIGIGSTPLAFLVNGISFLVSAVLLLPLLGMEFDLPKATEPRGHNPLRDLREGFAVVFKSPWLWITILVLAVTNVTLSGPYSVSIPFLVDQNWHGDVNVLGLLYAIFPIGYIIGSVWFGRMAKIRHRGPIAYFATAIAGLGMIVIGLPLPLPFLMVAALMNGAALETFNLIWTNTMQEMVPPEKLGRVSSIDSLGSFGLLPIGFAIAGWATQHFGPAVVCIAGGLITAAVSLIGLMHPKINQLD